MPKKTPFLVSDELIKMWAISTMAGHLGRDLEGPVIMCDGLATFYLETDEEKILLDTIQGSVTRIVTIPGAEPIAEEWFMGEVLH